MEDLSRGLSAPAAQPRKLTVPELEFGPRSPDTCSNAEVAVAVASVADDDDDVVDSVAVDPVMALFKA